VIINGRGSEARPAGSELLARHYRSADKSSSASRHSWGTEVCMSSASLLGGMPHDSSDDALARGGRPAAPPPRKSAPSKGSDVVEDLSDFEEIVEDDGDAVAEGAVDS